MPERSGRTLQRLKRWWAGSDGKLAPLAGERFVGTGLEAAVGVARAAGSHLLAGPALAGRPALAGVARGSAAAAIGLALGGVRTTLVVADEELEVGAPLLADAVARRVPLVVVAVGGRGWREVAAAGATLLVPGDVQECIDLAMVARLYAEDSLATVVVALEDEALAAAIQSARLPVASELRERFGSAADSVHPATPAQRALFGEHRRRVPRWHDAGAPRRLGGEPNALGSAAASAGNDLFFARDRARRLEEACSAVAAATGRELEAVVGRSLSRSVDGVLGTGPVALQAAAVAEAMRRDGARVNVLRLRWYAPFPANLIAGLAEGGRSLAILDRAPRVSGEGVLAEAAAAALAPGGGPIVVATLVVAGRDPRPSPGELAAAIQRFVGGARGRLDVGLPAEGERRELYPKRAARHDALVREEPRLAELAGERATALDARPAGAITLRLDRRPGEESLVPELAQLLDDLAGGYLRARVEQQARGAGLALSDRLSWAPRPLSDPGRGGTCEIEWVEASSSAGGSDGAMRRERTLGALLAEMMRRGALEITERRLRSAREKRLTGLGDEEKAARLDALVAGFEEPPVAGAPRLASAPAAHPPLPFATTARADHLHGQLGDATRFWDQVGLPLRESPDAVAGVDPEVALAVTPACSAPLGAETERLPRLDATLCTGCGLCWSLCPHAAIEARALAPATALESAMTAAAAAGRSAEPLRRFLPKLAVEWEKRARAATGGGAGALLMGAGVAVLDGARLDGERREQADAALAALAAPLGELAMIAAQPFAAGGDLLALALDPERCTDCGICAAACEPQAWREGEREGEAVQAGRARVAAARALPTPPRKRVEALAAAPEPGRVAALLLDPDASRTLEGFDAAPGGDAARLVVRQALATASFALAPRRTAVAARARELGERLSAEVRNALAHALPGSDLEDLARGLDRLDAPTAGLPELAGRLAGAVEQERVDVTRLRRLVDAARAVADLEAALGGDRERPARAPLSVVVGGGEALAWARGAFDNPFALPAVVAESGALGVARGLAAAEAVRAIAEARVLRRARLELERPGEVAAAMRSELAWGDLNLEERTLATPVVVLVDERAEEALGEEMLAILAGELPVVVMSLAPLPGRRPSPWAALAFAASTGIVAHATPMHADALATAVEAAVGGAGALVRLLAPARDRSVSAYEDLEKIRRAVEARVFPLSCRDAAAHTTAAALRVDPLAEAGAREAHHAAELAAMEESHRADLERLEGEVRRRLAETARGRLLEIAAARRREVS